MNLRQIHLDERTYGMYLWDRSRNVVKAANLAARVKSGKIIGTRLRSSQNDLNARRVGTGKRNMALGDIPGWLPDANDQMLSITEQASIMRAAASQSNWDMAAHAYRGMTKRLRAFATYRQQTHALQAELADTLISDCCGPLKNAIERCDAAAFNVAWSDFLHRVGLSHAAVGFDYIEISEKISYPSWMRPRH